MTLRDSCNVRRLTILAGAWKAAAEGREKGLYLRLGVADLPHCPSLFLLPFSLTVSTSASMSYPPPTAAAAAAAARTALLNNDAKNTVL